MKNEFDYGHDQRQISMPLKVYNADLQAAEYRGRKDASRRFAKIVKAAKDDPRDAVCMIVEDFEDDQASIDQMLLALDLMKTAEELWGRRNDAEQTGVGYDNA